MPAAPRSLFAVTRRVPATGSRHWRTRSAALTRPRQTTSATSARSTTACSSRPGCRNQDPGADNLLDREASWDLVSAPPIGPEPGEPAGDRKLFAGIRHPGRPELPLRLL